jgi:SAM-dependent methyltransferase
MPALHQTLRRSMFGLVHHPHGYRRSAGHLAGPLYARVAADVASAGLPADAHLLDLGTGPGLLPLRIAAAAPGLVIEAVDLSAEMIAEARANAAGSPDADRLTFTVADVAALPFPDASFDLVVSTISQHHWTDPGAGLREAARVLRPGGRAWIYDFRWALRRAQRAAGTLPAGVTVTRQSPLPGGLRVSLIGRLVLTAADAA